MKFVPAAVSVKLARQILVVKKNSPAIMFTAGAIGTVAATVLACKATLKFDQILTEAEVDKENFKNGVGRPLKDGKVYTEKDLSDDLRLLRVQTAVKVAKLYAPAVGVGVVSLGLLTGSHITLTKRNTAITAAYAVLDRGFNEYRARVKDELGEEKDREFRFGSQLKEIVEEGEHGHEVKTVKRIADDPTKIYAKLFDEGNRHWSNHPNDNRNFILTVQSWMNNKLIANGHVFLNDVYDALGFERTKAGAVVGWVKNNPRGSDGYISFDLEKNGDQQATNFMQGYEKSIWLDFNVDGMVYDLLGD